MDKEKNTYISLFGYIGSFVLGIAMSVGVITLQQEDFEKVVDKNIAMSDAIENLNKTIDAKNALPPVLVYSDNGPTENTDIRRIITSEKQLTEYMKARELTGVIEPEELHRLSVINNIDPGYVLATFLLEVGYSADSDAFVYGNNPGGIRCGQDYCSYPNSEKGFEDLTDLLRIYTEGSSEFIGQRYTPATIREKWAAAGGSKEITAIWQDIVMEVRP